MSCEITVVSISGDVISVTEGGIYTTGNICSEKAGNLQNRTIRIATCEGIRIYLGPKNKLTAVNYFGGEAGGTNVGVSYTFTTFNHLTVMHSDDPNANYTWEQRGQYLLDL